MMLTPSDAEAASNRTFKIKLKPTNGYNSSLTRELRRLDSG
jgi:hypothetical protein